MAFDLPIRRPSRQRLKDIFAFDEEEAYQQEQGYQLFGDRFPGQAAPFDFAAPSPPMLPPPPMPTAAPVPVQRPDITKVFAEPPDITGFPLETQQALQESRIVETQYEHQERQRAVQEIVDLTRQLDNPYTRTNYIENMEREARGMTPRASGSMEAFALYDAVLDDLAYGIVHGFQNRLMPGEQDLDTRIANMVNETETVMDPNTGQLVTRPIPERRRIRISAEEEILPWYITEPIKLIPELLIPVSALPRTAATVGFRTALMSKLPKWAGRGTVKLSGGGNLNMPGTSLMRVSPAYAKSAGDQAFFSGPWMRKVPAAAASRGARIMAGEETLAGYTPGRLVGGGVVEIVGPEEFLVKAPVKGGRHFNFKPIKAGLTPIEQISREVQRFIPGKVMEDPYGTGMGRIYNENLRQVRHVAAAESRGITDILYSAFDIDENGLVKSLAHAGVIEDTSAGRAMVGITEELLPKDIGAFMPQRIPSAIRHGREALAMFPLPGTAPSIADIAARLPRYLPYLDEPQKAAMAKLKSIFDNYAAILDDAEIPVELSRKDVMEGGFYVHRGTPRIVREKTFRAMTTIAGRRVGFPGVQLPRRVFKMPQPGFRRKASFREAEAFDSMSEAIQGVQAADGKFYQYIYPHIRESLRSYSEDIGRDLADIHGSNYLLSLMDLDSGLLKATRVADQVPDTLRKQVESLRRRIRQGGESMRRVAAQSPVLKREMDRAGDLASQQASRTARRIGEATARTERARQRLLLQHPTLLPDGYELKAVQDQFTHALKTALSAKQYVGKYIEQLRLSRKLTRAGDRALAKSLQAMSRAEREAVEFWRTAMQEGGGRGLFDYMEHIDDLTRRTDDLAVQSEHLDKQLEIIEGRAATAVEGAADAVSEQANLRRFERIEIKRDHTIGILRREIEMLELEQRRLNRVLTREVKVGEKGLTEAEIRQAQNILRTEKIQNRIDSYKKTLGDIQEEWTKALELSRKAPPDMGVIPLPGLGGYFWPDNLAQAARKYLVDDPSIAGTAKEQFYDAFNSLYRGARGTLDNSRMWIQGILRLYDNPMAAQRALRFTWQAWGVPGSERIGVARGTGERVIDSFFRNFDEKAVANGRFTSTQLAARGLPITGSDTEFSFGRGITAGFGRLPLIRNANRAFGAGGDVTRLEWVDDYLEGMQRKFSMEELDARGDVERICKAIAAATGWSPGRVGGNLGDLVTFAPRFLASRFETLGRAIVGTPSILSKPLGPYGWAGDPTTVDKRMAARSMLKMIAFATSLTYGGNWAQGRETDYRPVIKVMEGTKDEHWIKNSNFNRLRTPWGTDVALMTTWDSLLGLIITSSLVTEEGGPHQALRSMASGLVSNIWDFMTGKDGIGNPVGFGGGQETDWQKISTRLLQNFIPFISEDIPRETDEIVKDASAGNVAHSVGRLSEMIGWTFHGGKSYPMSPGEERTENRIARGQQLNREGAFDSYEVYEEGVTRLVARTEDEIEDIEEDLETGPWKFKFRDLPPDVRDLIDEDISIQQLTLEIQKRRRERNDPLQSYLDDKTNLRDRRDTEISTAWEETGHIPNRALRSAVKASHRSYRDRGEELNYQDEHRELLADLEKSTPPEAALDRAVEEYLAVMDSPDLENALGQRDFDEQEKRINELDTRWSADSEYGPDMLGQVRAWFNRNDHDAEKAVRELQETLRPFWEVGDRIEEGMYISSEYTDPEKIWLERFIQGKENGNKSVQSYNRNLANNNDSTIIKDYERTVQGWHDWMRGREAGPPGAPIGEQVMYEDAAEIDAAYIRGGYSGDPATVEGGEAFMEAIIAQIAEEGPTEQGMAPAAVPAPFRGNIDLGQYPQAR